MRRLTKQYEEKSDDPDRHILAQEYWTSNWPAAAAEVYYIRREAKHRLRHIRASTLAIVSKQDLTVPLDVLDLLREKLAHVDLDAIILEDSGHVLVNDTERDTVANAIIRYFSD